MTDFAFWCFSTVARFASGRPLVMNWQHLSYADRQFCLGAHPQSPCYFKEDKSPPSKPKFKQHLPTSFRWPSHDVTHGVNTYLHLEFHSSWIFCTIWVAFEKQINWCLCNYMASVSSTFCCGTSRSLASIKATSILSFRQLVMYILCYR